MLTPEEIETKIKNISSEDIFCNQDYLVREALQKGFFSWDSVEMPDRNEEIMEWYTISKWLCAHLRKVGAVILENECGCFWGRTETGQRLQYDGDLKNVVLMLAGYNFESDETDF
jgi:hypothetical protein